MVDVTEIARTLGPPLYRFFLAASSRAEAEELVQEVFVRLIESGYSADLGKLEAYAWGIAQNVRRERIRSRHKLVLMEDLPEPSTETKFHDDTEALRQAVLRLREPERTVMQMTLADLSVDEIGEKLKMPSGTVKSHVHRAKENLREKLKQWGIL